MGLDRPIDITANQRKTILALLKRHLPNTTAWVYGSRVKWTARPQSDLDLAVFATPDQERRVAELREAFEESNLPFRVDLFIWDAVPEQFRKEIEAEHVVLVERQGQIVGVNWQVSLLGELVNNFDARRIPLSKRERENRHGAYPYYGATGVMDHIDDFLFEGLHLLVAEDGSVERPDGTPFLQLANGKFWVNNHAHVLKGATDNETKFLYYALSNVLISPYIGGSVQAKLSQANLNKIPIVHPTNKADRRAIVSVLGTLDDKIELNRRMNETLEAMARILFKSWFIDFDPVRAKMAGRDPGLPEHLANLFPDRLVDSELGSLPEGWEVKRIEDIAERVAMGPFGSSIKVSTFVDQGIPVISGQHLKGMLLDDAEYRFITQEHADKLEKANVRRGDVIFTHAGSIGQVSCIPLNSQFERYVISQRQFYMRCDDSKISPLFIVHFFKTPEGQHKLLANTSSTGVPSISRPVTYLRSIKLCLPPKSLWYRFTEIAGGLHLKTEWATAESRTLATQRDMLLPKLISGEIKVGNEVCYD